MIEEKYEKVDDLTFKVISTETTIEEQFLTLKDLKARKEGLLAQRQDLTDDLNMEIDKIDENISKVDKWINEAYNLGVVEAMGSSSSSSSSSSLSKVEIIDV